MLKKIKLLNFALLFLLFPTHVSGMKDAKPETPKYVVPITSYSETELNLLNNLRMVFDFFLKKTNYNVDAFYQLVETLQRYGIEYDFLSDFLLARSLQVKLSPVCYFDRLVKYMGCSVNCFVVATIYIDRFVLCVTDKLNSKINSVPSDNSSVLRSLLRMQSIFNERTFYYIFLIALVEAIKFYEDDYFILGFYAKIGGISLNELIKLDKLFLSLIHYDLRVSADEWNNYLTLLSNKNIAYISNSLQPTEFTCQVDKSPLTNW